MEFEFQDSIYVDEYDLNEMCNLCKEGCPITDAIDEISADWDDCDYYKVDYIKDQLIKEIKRRLTQEKIEIKD